RVTDDATMNVVEMVLGGQINSDIVGLISEQGGRAVGLSGKDAQLMTATRKAPMTTHGDAGENVTVDLGRVGEIETVRPALLRDLLERGYVPVVAPIAKSLDGVAVNVNADTAAGKIAGSLGAAKMMLMTDVAGEKDQRGGLMRSHGARQSEELIEQGVIAGGMIPKVRCALDAVEAGVSKVHIFDGRTLHALLLEIFTDEGVGTEIQKLDRA